MVAALPDDTARGELAGGAIRDDVADADLVPAHGLDDEAVPFLEEGLHAPPVEVERVVAGGADHPQSLGEGTGARRIHALAGGGGHSPLRISFASSPNFVTAGGW